MRCAVTGVPTANKWKGFYLTKEIVEMAKEMRAEDEANARPGLRTLTLRQCLAKLQEQWQADKVKAAIDNG